VRRLAPDDNINLVAVSQIRGLLDRLPGAATATVQAHQQMPLVVFDGGFDPVQLQVELAGAPVQVLVRIRSDRNFYAARRPRRDGRPGRPARHGAKLSLADPATWPAPTATWQEADPQYGKVTVTAWDGVGCIPSSAPTATPMGTCGSWLARWYACTWHGCPGVPGRPRRCGCGGPAHRGSPRSWRLCGGPTFAASTSSTPSALEADPALDPARPRTPEQADRFTWAVVAGYTQLRLARTILTDLRLPWEQPLASHQLTPERVRRRFRAVLAIVGTPASAPKPHGRSPGRPRGTLRGPAPRHPAIKLTA
jgi:hypothetical protein